MHIIDIKVNADGTLTLPSEPIILSNEYENKRVRLKFDIDTTIDNTYHYIRFTHAKTSILFRVSTDYFDITRAITSYEGQWMFAFIVTDDVPNADGTFTCNYQYTSDPYEAVVTKGIEARDFYTGDQLLVKQLFEETFTTLIVPEYVTEIGTYFASQYPRSYSLTVGKNVRKIGERAFYYSSLNSISFEETPTLNTISDYALSRVSGLKKVVWPQSVTNYGQHILEYSSVEELSFESFSKITSVGSYSFWNLDSLVKLELPDCITAIVGNTACIKSCANLKSIKIPSSITSVINKISFATDLTSLETIELGTNFNASANFSNCENLSHDSLVNMLYALKNNSGLTAKSLTIGATNLAKLNDTEKNIAYNKNWALS